MQEAGQAIAAGRLTARALVEACLARIETLDPVLGAWVALDAGGARAAADRADRELAAGRSRGPLHGIPYGLKDILFTRELPTLAASRRPPVDDGTEAEVHHRLRDAGAILVGKLNTYEYGTGTGAVFDDLPAPLARNPWNPDHFTGGSSTGAGCAVAAGMVPFAIGTDTGGSVRLPAAACGLVGLKATYDLVPRDGMLPNCPSQDHVGPLARTVADAALVLDVVGRAAPVAGAAAPGRLDGLRVAVVRSFHDTDPVAVPAVAEAFERAARSLSSLGAEIVDRRVAAGLRDFRACGRIVNAAESHAIHRGRLAEPETLGTALRDKLEAAAGLGAADYLDALRWRRALVGTLVAAMEGCDAMLCAGTMAPAPRLDDETGCAGFTGDSAMTPFSLSGQPSLVLSTGLDGAGLPVGMQLATRPFAEALLVRIAAALEADSGFAGRRPTDPPAGAGPNARPPAAPSRDGRAGRLAAGMAESVGRIPRPLPDRLGSALVFDPKETWR
ncbi:MAG: amidase [Thalassobaculum sp.]|uniref:amidase n=1 Tax=Thalassobaculum sp. TaxID=2022740 RepID=UPI0032F04D1B